MKFDLGDVLSRAWQISWKHKALWVIGNVYGFLVSIASTLIFIPLFAILSGWALIFAKSTWVPTYLHLMRPFEVQPLPEKVIA